MQPPLPSTDVRAPRVLVLGRDPLIRASFVERLADQVVAEAIGLEPSEAALLPGVPADVAVWDLGPDPVRAKPMLAQAARAEVPVVVLLPEGMDGTEAISESGGGVLPRDASPRALRAAIDGAAQGLMVFDPAFMAVTEPDPKPEIQAGLPLEPLTPREIEVLELLATGCSNRQIAEALGFSTHTAKFHVNAILDKMDAQSRTEAVVRAIQLGVVML